MHDATEQRTYPRMDPEFTARLRTEDCRLDDVACIDLSAGGALVRSSRRAEVGDAVELYLKRLGEGRPLRVQGEVVRTVDEVTGNDETSVLAIRFEELDGTTRLELDEFVGVEPPPPSAAERRQAERHEARFLVTFHTERELLHEYTNNLSARGMFLHTDEKIEIGAEVDIEIMLPNYHDPVDIRARVVRRVTPNPQTGQRGGLGIEFLEPDVRAVTFLEERVGAYRAAGI